MKIIQNTIKNPHKQHRHSLSTCWSFMDISRKVSENVRVCFKFGLQKKKKTKSNKPKKQKQKRKPCDHEIFYFILIELKWILFKLIMHCKIRFQCLNYIANLFMVNAIGLMFESHTESRASIKIGFSFGKPVRNRWKSWR